MGLSFKDRFSNLSSAFKLIFTGEDSIIEEQDRVRLANMNANGSGDVKPNKIEAKARHAGMIYNTSLSARYGEESYTPQEYDMSVIANALDTDSYFRRAVEKYIELMWKSGYRFIGKNTKAVRYLRKRLEQISLATSIPEEEFLRSSSAQLITYGNVYISKVRKLNASGGNYRRDFTGKTLTPVAGYFVEDTVSMRLAFKKNGEPIGFKQHIPGTYKAKIWRPWNMIHMTYSKKPGLRVGTPFVWPVLDDIRALRKIEQNLELLIYQHTVPLFHYKVGTPERPAQDAEVAQAESEVASMPPNGALVTSERHNINVIGAERESLNISEYIAHFKNRVFAGLGMSSVGMGESDTSNRSTASVIDKNMHNTTETFQKTYKMFFDEFIIKELLAEGGYVYDALDDTNKVELYFPPVDKESQYAKENHYAQMYAQYAITESEMRQEFGRDVIDDNEREDMYFERVSKNIAIIHASDESYTNTTKTITTKKGDTTTKTTHQIPEGSSPAEKVGENKNRPTNQSGKMMSKPSIPKNDFLHNYIVRVSDATKNDVLESYSDYINGEDPSFRVLDRIDRMVFKISKESILEKFKNTEIEDNEYIQKQVVGIFDNTFDRVKKIFEMKNEYDAITKINSIFSSSKLFLDNLINQQVEERLPSESS